MGDLRPQLYDRLVAVLGADWRPGIFTRNFGWGTHGPGLNKLHVAINASFDGSLVDITRQQFLSRTVGLGDDAQRVVPLNFFMFSYLGNSKQDMVLADELVYQALTYPHDVNFDRLAVFALNLSHGGRWSNSESFHRHPAEWARNFIVDVVASGGEWDPAIISATAIQDYLDTSPHYSALTSYKLSRSLFRIYEMGGATHFRTAANEEWWGSALFLALDRTFADQGIDPTKARPATALEMLDRVDFWKLTGVARDDSRIAATDLIDLYLSLGGRERLMAAASAGQSQAGQSGQLSTADLEKSERPVARIFAAASRQVRDRKIVRTLRALYEDRCAVCGEALIVMAPKVTYSEVGHIKPVGAPYLGPDHISNTLPFCPNHHRAFDRGGVSFSTSGTGIVVESSRIDPRIHGRQFVPHPLHGLNVRHLDWHRSLFA